MLPTGKLISKPVGELTIGEVAELQTRAAPALKLYVLSYTVTWAGACYTTRMIASAPSEDAARALASAESGEDIWLERRDSQCLPLLLDSTPRILLALRDEPA